MELEAFLPLTEPYAPLDLQVTKAANAEEASFLRNYYLGVTGRQARIDVAGLANAFHCGPMCTDPRRAFALEHMDALKELASTLKEAKNVRLAAQWGQPGSFRINEMFKIGGWVREAIPSETMGFVPSGQWNEFPDVHSYFTAREIRESSAMLLIQALEATQAAAAVRLSGNAVQVLLSGIGDNQAGLLFQAPTAPAPEVGSRLTDGTEYKIIEELEPGVIYYETT